MNPSASAYVPSTAVAGALARRRPTPPVTPPIASQVDGGGLTPGTASPFFMTAAERLRGSAKGAVKGAATPASLRAHTAASSIRSSAAQTPVLTTSNGGRASRTQTAMTPSSRPLPASTAAVEPLTKTVPFIRYTRQQLLSLRPAAMEQVTRGRIADHPPFVKIPESFAHLLGLPHALEYLDVNAATQLVEHCAYASPLLLSSPSAHAQREKRHGASNNDAAAADEGDEGDEEAHARQYDCPICAQGGPQPCLALQRILQRASKYAMSTKLGAALMQPALVVKSLLQLALVFEAKQSSLRLRMLAERSPRVVHLVEEYLCGEGYHLPLPQVTAHDDWANMNAMLKFDAIRDNKTRVITDLSKHWKKRRTQFEQFVHFFAFRDARPVRPAKNMITQSVKPGMVAMLTGDLTAMLLLHRLGFFIPPDYYWSVFPFLRQALGEGTRTYDVVRHLGVYFASAQPADMYNPVNPPPRLL